MRSLLLCLRVLELIRVEGLHLQDVSELGEPRNQCYQSDGTGCNTNPTEKLERSLSCVRSMGVEGVSGPKEMLVARLELESGASLK